VVGATGSFSVPFILPDTYSAGNYTLSVLSTGCPTPKTLTIVIDPLDLSGCGPNSDRTYTPGEVVTWTLMGKPFDTSKPVTVNLTPRGPGGSGSATLYSGAFPASGDVTITIPNSTIEAKYFIEQVGLQKNHKTMTKSCPVRVGLPYVLAGTAGDAGPTSAGSIAGSAGKAMIVVAAGLLLLALRVHAPRRRRRTT
jgi:hypothetical protein